MAVKLSNTTIPPARIVGMGGNKPKVGNITPGEYADWLNNKGQASNPYLYAANKNAAPAPNSNLASSSGNGVGGSGGGINYNSYFDTQKSLQQQLLDRLNGASQGAYDTNMAGLADAYNRRQGYLDENLNSALAGMQSDTDFASGKVNANADTALQQAYINMMMNQRDMPQLLAAQGISGGMSESTLAGIRGNYGNARNSLETSRGQGISELMNSLSKNQSTVRTGYNDALAADAYSRMTAEQNLLNQLTTGQASDVRDYYSNMAQIDTSQMQAAVKAQEAAAARAARQTSGGTGDNATISTTQAREMFNKGVASPQVLNALRQSGYDDATLAQSMMVMGKTTAQIQQILNGAG